MKTSDVEIVLWNQRMAPWIENVDHQTLRIHAGLGTDLREFLDRTKDQIPNDLFSLVLELWSSDDSKRRFILEADYLVIRSS